MRSIDLTTRELSANLGMLVPSKSIGRLKSGQAEHTNDKHQPSQRPQSQNLDSVRVDRLPRMLSACIGQHPSSALSNAMFNKSCGRDAESGRQTEADTGTRKAAARSRRTPGRGKWPPDRGATNSTACKLAVLFKDPVIQMNVEIRLGNLSKSHPLKWCHMLWNPTAYLLGRGLLSNRNSGDASKA